MSNTKKVDEFMSKLEHPLKAELEAVRSIIVNANPKIEEDVKWGGPAFFTKKTWPLSTQGSKTTLPLSFTKESSSISNLTFLKTPPRERFTQSFIPWNK